MKYLSVFVIIYGIYKLIISLGLLLLSSQFSSFLPTEGGEVTSFSFILLITSGFVKYIGYGLIFISCLIIASGIGLLKRKSWACYIVIAFSIFSAMSSISLIAYYFFNVINSTTDILPIKPNMILVIKPLFWVVVYIAAAKYIQMQRKTWCNQPI